MVTVGLGLVPVLGLDFLGVHEPLVKHVARSFDGSRTGFHVEVLWGHLGNNPVTLATSSIRVPVDLADTRTKDKGRLANAALGLQHVLCLNAITKPRVHKLRRNLVVRLAGLELGRDTHFVHERIDGLDVLPDAVVDHVEVKRTSISLPVVAHVEVSKLLPSAGACTGNHGLVLLGKRDHPVELDIDLLLSQFAHAFRPRNVRLLLVFH